MRITFINVGYGDAILLQGDNGYTALLDGGSNLDEEFADDCFRIRAVDYLQKLGITHLDDVIISHIHEDHVCGLEEVLRHIPTDRLSVPYFFETVFISTSTDTGTTGSPQCRAVHRGVKRILPYT